MPAYLMVQTKITRPEAWSGYRAAIGPLMQTFGGRCIVRAAEVDILEGSHDGRRLAVFEFATLESIHAFWDSPAYAELKKMREGSGELDVWAVPGVEDA